MRKNSIGVTLDDIPGIWRIDSIEYPMLYLISIDSTESKSVRFDNFWVLL
jgi:hypothetical protein